MYIGRFHKYKIAAVCVSEIQNDHLAYITNTICKALEDRGYKVFIFSSFTGFGVMSSYKRGEVSIFHLLNLELIDVLITLPESIKNERIMKILLDYARIADTPVICADGIYEGCTSISYDYEQGFIDVITHLIECHDCRDMSFIGGSGEEPMAVRMAGVFRNTLEKYNIECSDENICFGSSVQEIVQSFFSTEKRLPRAFVCVNDDIAFAAAKILRRSGMQIPEDIIVTGFNASCRDKKYITNELSSAMIDTDELAKIITETCDGYSSGTEQPQVKQLKLDFIPARTCGCTVLDKNYVGDMLYNVKEYKTTAQDSENRMVEYYADTVGCKSLSDLSEQILKYMEPASAVCINTDFLTKKSKVFPKEYHSVYTEKMIALCRRDGANIQKSVVFPTEDLLPQLGDVLKRQNRIIFVPLHFQSEIIGYYAVTVNHFNTDYHNIRRFANATNQILENFKNYHSLKLAHNELDMTYSIDPLTELYNRRGYFLAVEKMLTQLNNRHLLMISFDMDGLKTINDTYGHAEGDKAISQMAAAMRSVCGSEGVCARFGGDEFILTMPCDDPKRDPSRIIGMIQTYLDNYNRSSGAEYTVSASIGAMTHAVDDNTDISELIKKTDHLMYDQKRIKRATFESPTSEKLTQLANSTIADYENRLHEIYAGDASCTYFYMNYSNFKWHLAKNENTPPCMISATVNPLRAIWLSDSIYEDDKSIFMELASHIKNGFDNKIRKNEHSVFIRLTDSGEPVWYNISVRLCADESGTLTEMAGCVRPATTNEIMQIEICDYYTTTDNPILIYDLITQKIRSNRDKKYAVIQFDIKRFKLINDGYGDETGTELLYSISRQLKEFCTNEQISVRQSSDIFMLVTPYNTRSDVDGIIAVLQERLKSFRGIRYELAFGVYLAENGDEPIRLMGDRAAIARKSIKSNAIENVAYFDEKMQHSAYVRRFVESSMKAALEEHQFNIYLQPKFSISSSRAVGYEALVRWMHPQKGIISPGEFIPLFEENGFILKLDAYVWECACQVLRDWIDRGFSPMPISVNVSRAHLRDDSFLDILDTLMEKYRLPKHLLELEITESVEGEDVTRITNLIKDRGYTLLMDDFGSGYSSLNTLKSTKFDILKIDRGFLSAFLTDDRGKKIISHTISMSRDVGLGLIAEGVETSEQARFLAECGCDIAQGFYYARPMTVQDAEKYLILLNINL